MPITRREMIAGSLTASALGAMQVDSSAVFAQSSSPFIPGSSMPFQNSVGIHTYDWYDHWSANQQLRVFRHVERLGVGVVRFPIEWDSSQDTVKRYIALRNGAIQDGRKVIFVAGADGFIKVGSAASYGTQSWANTVTSTLLVPMITSLATPNVAFELFPECNYLQPGDTLPSLSLTQARIDACILLHKTLKAALQHAGTRPNILGPAVLLNPFTPQYHAIFGETVIATCVKLGLHTNYWTAISIHPYGSDLYNGPEARLGGIAKIVSMSPLPCVVSEYGYPEGTWTSNTPPTFIRTDLALHARQNVVSLFVNLAAGARFTVLYELNDEDRLMSWLDANVPASERFFGLFSCNYENGDSINWNNEFNGSNSIDPTTQLIPNPAAAGVMGMISDLRGLYYVKTLQFGNNYRCEFQSSDLKTKKEVWWTSDATANSVQAQWAYPYYPRVQSVDTFTSGEWP